MPCGVGRMDRRRSYESLHVKYEHCDSHPTGRRACHGSGRAARRRRRPGRASSRRADYEPEEIAEPTICVVPAERSDAIETRLANERVKSCQIGIMRKLPDPADDDTDAIHGEALDAMTNLVDRVCDLWDEAGRVAKPRDGGNGLAVDRVDGAS